MQLQYIVINKRGRPRLLTALGLCPTTVPTWGRTQKTRQMKCRVNIKIQAPKSKRSLNK